MNYLDKPQMRQLLATARASSELHWLMFLVGYVHGLRATEILSLTSTNVRDGYLTVQRLKGSLKTTQDLKMDEDSLFDERAALENLCRLTLPGYRLFPLYRMRLWRLMQKYGKQAGLPAHLLHPHSLKHSCGHAVIPAGIEYTRQYLGHKSISSTGVYIRVNDRTACQKVQGLL